MNINEHREGEEEGGSQHIRLTTEFILPDTLESEMIQRNIPAAWLLKLCQGVRRFERFEFLSEKINFTALGGSKSSSFEPDTSHP